MAIWALVEGWVAPVVVAMSSQGHLLCCADRSNVAVAACVAEKLFVIISSKLWMAEQFSTYRSTLAGRAMSPDARKLARDDDGDGGGAAALLRRDIHCSTPSRECPK